MPPETLKIHPHHPVGKFRALHGVNNGPRLREGALNLEIPFREARFPDVRLHDCNYPARDVVDISAVFPNFDRDPDDPASYEFTRTDQYLQAIIDCGMSITDRLGYAIDHNPVKIYAYPPKDFARWARICLGVARHYNEGWAGGFKDWVGRWEVWNEPNLYTGPLSTAAPGTSPTWLGTWEQYFELYAVTARTLKDYNPKWRVGGPAMAGNVHGFLDTFVGYCAREKLPLDFCSWHAYSSDLERLRKDTRDVRETLDKHGYPKAENLLTEWHFFPPGADWKILKGLTHPLKQQLLADLTEHRSAAFTLAALLTLQDEPLDMAHFYTADTSAAWGIFDIAGAPRKAYHALFAMGRLIETPNRLKFDLSAGAGLIVAAGVNDAGNQFTLLIVNCTSTWRNPLVTLGDEPLVKFVNAPHKAARMVSSVHALSPWPLLADGVCMLPPDSILVLETALPK